MNQHKMVKLVLYESWVRLALREGPVRQAPAVGEKFSRTW